MAQCESETRIESTQAYCVKFCKKGNADTVVTCTDSSCPLYPVRPQSIWIGRFK